MASTIAATVRINNAAAMTAEQRKEVAAWLRQHAVDLLKDGKDYDDKFHGTIYK